MAEPVAGTKMKAIVVEKAGGPWTLQDVVLSELRDDELLVEMQYSGICHTVSPCFLLMSITLNR
jgi:Zn-dependent alcohol dehydrogenase